MKGIRNMKFNDFDEDLEFKGKKVLSNTKKNFFQKYKTEIIIEIILVTVTAILLLLSYLDFKSQKTLANYLVLYGEETITMIQDSKYIEPGYNAYNSKGEDLTNKVKVNTTLDTSKIGEYEITYTIENMIKTRKVIIVKKPKEQTSIQLEKVNEDINVYINLGEEYIEPGYKAYNSTGKDLTDQVEITGKVDTSKPGKYILVYSVIEDNSVVANEKRTVIVMNTEIKLNLEPAAYTNKNVDIQVSVIADYFDYLILPDGNKVNDKNGTYSVNDNGTYTFKVCNKKGSIKEEKIEVSNIDRILPEGSCKIDYSNNKSVITITAKDISGISKFIYNNKAYTDNKITVQSYIENAKIDIYDNAGNIKQVSCKSSQPPQEPTESPPSNTTTSLPSITNITNDGVIVTIKAKKEKADISGYYFSYTNTRPNKNSGGYISTSSTKIDIVRLPGKTYVWVEDKDGKISSPATINLNNNIIPFTGSGYTILQGTKLSDYLKNKGWSIEEFNKLIARSVRAAGLHSKQGAATAVVALEVVLIQKYGIKLPYWRGGKTNSMGAYGSWGMYRKNPTYEGYNYYGMDCDGLVNWSYKNAGFVYDSILANSYYNWSGIDYSKGNGEIGDVLKTNGHVAIIVGKTNDYFIVAEAAGKSLGIIISEYPYNKEGYKIIKGERLANTYEKISASEYPTGF